MENIEVSIIMGIYNCEKYLEESINSILNQTYTNWELIMCDDGSKDNTYQIAERLEEKYPNKIIVLKNDTNMGLNYTLNKCLKCARGKYIARQDGDDISLPNRLEIEVEFLNKNLNYEFVSGNMIFFDENDEWGRTNTKGEPKLIEFMNGSPFCHAPCMVRKDAFDAVEGYTVDKRLLRVEDYHLWIKMYSKGFKGYNLKDILYKMRNDKNALKRRTFNNRINEVNVKKIAFYQLNIPQKYYYKIYIPLLKAIVPNFCYKILYKMKYKIKNRG